MEHCQSTTIQCYNASMSVIEISNHPTTTIAAESPQTLRASVLRALSNYFDQLGDQVPCELYDLVIREVEGQLLETVMLRVKGNQTKAADMLGLSRGTLRKKLKQHHLE